MEREKRETKPPQAFVIDKVCYPRAKKKQSKRKGPQRAKYQVIPTPMKFSSIPSFFALYADIGLKIYQGSLHADTRMLNQYLDVREMKIVKEPDFRKINLSMEKKVQTTLPPWQHLVEGLLTSESNELKEWGVRIKEFSLNYEETNRALKRKELIIDGMNEEELLEITEKTENKIAKFFKEYPCICFTRTSEKNNSGIKEMSFNEQYINEIGYSMETFTSTALQEGFPRMMPTNTAYTAKNLVENYYSLGKEGFESPETIADLLMKNGYMRRIRYKMFFLPSYRNKTYTVSSLVILLGKEKSIIKNEAEEVCEVNKTFLKKIIIKEKQMNKFMTKFYNKELTLPYLNRDKICKIRELDTVQNDEENCIQKEEA